jgi:hypothetical protein
VRRMMIFKDGAGNLPPYEGSPGRMRLPWGSPGAVNFFIDAAEAARDSARCRVVTVQRVCRVRFPLPREVTHGVFTCPRRVRCLRTSRVRIKGECRRGLPELRRSIRSSARSGAPLDPERLDPERLDPERLDPELRSFLAPHPAGRMCNCTEQSHGGHRSAARRNTAQHGATRRNKSTRGAKQSHRARPRATGRNTAQQGATNPKRRRGTNPPGIPVGARDEFGAGLWNSAIVLYLPFARRGLPGRAASRRARAS